MALPAEKLPYTFADCLDWDENERIELINGEAYMMSSPTSDHQRILMGLSGHIYAYLMGKTCEVFPAPFSVRLFEKDGDAPEDVDTVVEPDISVICDRTKIDKRGCKGAPDLIIEILSPSTSRHDRFVKFNLYQRAGVREYWIVDPSEQSVQVFLLEDGHYTAKDFGSAEDKLLVNVLEDCVIDLSEVFPKEEKQEY